MAKLVLGIIFFCIGWMGGCMMATEEKELHIQMMEKSRKERFDEEKKWAKQQDDNQFCKDVYKTYMENLSKKVAQCLSDQKEKQEVYERVTSKMTEEEKAILPPVVPVDCRQKFNYWGVYSMSQCGVFFNRNIRPFEHGV